jgi:hypothetical protein
MKAGQRNGLSRVAFELRGLGCKWLFDHRIPLTNQSKLGEQRRLLRQLKLHCSVRPDCMLV